VDIFRIFDALNDVDQMTPAIQAVREHTGSVAEVGLSYTGNFLDPNENLYTLDYWLKLADSVVSAGCACACNQGHGWPVATSGRGDTGHRA
jgi:pyruvate carboxylase